MTNVLEREDKWDVDDQFTLPPLDDLVDGGRVDGDTVDLTSAYYDTPDGDLQAHGVLLRRRDGDDDTGWQLKVPAKGGRTELNWPLSDRPPAELTRLLDGLRLGKELDAVATIRTQRRRYRISVPPDRAVYAEVADDTVRASVGDQLQTWREVEVELGPAADRQPKRLRRRLRAAGASPSRYPSKLVHALHEQPAPESPSPAVAMLADYLSAQIDGIVAGDIGLRRGEDPIHDTRVAIRRLRSTLRIFGGQLDHTDGAADLDEDLRWFAGLLGEVRDCQVQERRFSEALNELSDALVLGPVRARISRDLKAIELPARKSVAEAMDTARYRNILGTLRSWRTNSPVNPDAPEKEVRKSAARAARKAEPQARRGADHR